MTTEEIKKTIHKLEVEKASVIKDGNYTRAAKLRDLIEIEKVKLESILKNNK